MSLFLTLARLLCQALVHSEDLALENLALRQQLAVFKRLHPQPPVRGLDRTFWVVLSRVWRGWANALNLVEPETVVRWHRQAFRRFWAWISRPRRARGRPRVARDVREAIRRIATENPTWGSPRIHGEMLKLGFEVSERTVARPVTPRPGLDATLVALPRVGGIHHRYAWRESA